MQISDHSRKEFQVGSNHFGLIVSGDEGELTYQGTRFSEFKRIIGKREDGLPS
jgi:hypothetical protein